MMADDIDRGCELEEKYREAALAVRKPEGPRATGECLWCEEPVDDGRRWCGPDCRNMWEAEAKKSNI